MLVFGPVVAALVAASPLASFPTTTKVLPELLAEEVKVTVTNEQFYKGIMSFESSDEWKIW